MSILLLALITLCAAATGVFFFLGFKKLGMTFLVFTGLGVLANLAFFAAITSSKM